MSRAGSLCRDLGTLVKRNKIKLCDYTTTEPARLAGVLCGNFRRNHAFRAAQPMNPFDACYAG